MKNFSEWIKSWLFSKPDKETKSEIDTLNTRNIHYVSLIVGLIQLLSLGIYFVANSADIDDSAAVGIITRVGLSVILCAIGFIISGRLLKNPDTIREHPQGVRIFIGCFVVLLIIWSMYVSTYNYVNYQQLLTFYTVELMAVLFVKLHPVFTAATILGSYILNYLILNFCFIPGLINPYNYMMLALISAAGSILNYRLTVNYIAQKNKANLLNDSLEIIANHDSITRLQNRYALNQHVPDYVGKDICIAMGDINRFKSVNDTHGHRVGDDVLKAFADILLEFFDDKSVFRYGGDEFLLVDQNSDCKAFYEKLQKVNERFASVQIGNLALELGCSFGCLRAHPNDPMDFFRLLTQADQKLYEEKERLNIKR